MKSGAEKVDDSPAVRVDQVIELCEKDGYPDRDNRARDEGLHKSVKKRDGRFVEHRVASGRPIPTGTSEGHKQTNPRWC